MPSKVDRGKQAGQLEQIDAANHANIQFTVIHLRLRRNPHPAAVDRRIRERSQHCGLVAKNCALSSGILREDFHAKWRELEQRRKQSCCIPAVPSQPRRQSIRATRHLAAQSKSGYATEVVRRIWRRILPEIKLAWSRRPARFLERRRNRSQINDANLTMPSTELSPSRDRILHAAEP